jgi:hypothetical protein
MKNSNFFFAFAALLVLAGAVMKIVNISIAPYLVGIGGIVIFILRLTNRPQTNDFRIKRLLGIQLLGSLLLVASAYFMYTDNPKNVWALTLFLAAFIEIFTIFRLPKE